MISFHRNMAEKKRENWKTTKKSTQVEETINKMYSAIKDKRIKKKFSIHLEIVWKKITSLMTDSHGKP